MTGIAVYIAARVALAGPAGGEVPAALAAEGEVVGGAVVERVERHPEYERYWLRFPAGALVPAEVTTRTPGNEGICDGGATALYPRPELAVGAPPEGYTTAMAALCPALAARPPTLRARGATGDVAVGVPVGDAGVRVGAMTAVVGALLLGLLGLLPRMARGVRAMGAGERAELATVAVASVAARAAWAPAGIFNGGGAAYEKIRLAWATTESPYGEGFGALFGPVLAWVGREPAHLFALDRGIAALAPVLLWAAARPAGRAVALAAGLGLALLPLHVGISATEAMHVVVTTLLLGAMAAVAAMGGARDAGGAPGGRLVDAHLGAVAALAVGLAANVRPEAVLLVGVPAGWLAVGGRWGAALGVGGAGALVAAPAVLGLDAGQDVLRASVWTDIGFWRGLLRPHVGAVEPAAGFSAFWHGGLTPVWAWPFVALGLTALPRAWGMRVAGWILLAEAPFWTKVFPVADASRLQLAAQPAWLLVAGFGAARAGEWLAGRLRGGRAPGAGRGAWLGAGLLAVGLVGWNLARPAHPDWANRREFRFLEANAPALPAGATVWVAETHHRIEAFADVMGTLGAARWRPYDQRPPGPAQGEEYVWLGLGCAQGDPGCVRVRDACGLSPWRTTRLGPPTDLDVVLPPEGVEVGWWRVGACGAGDTRGG